MFSYLLFLKTGIFNLLPNAVATSGFKTNILCECFKKSVDMEEPLLMNSIHGGQIKEVHNVPFNIITRPLPSELDEDKVLSLMETLKDPKKEHLVPPIDVLWVTGSEGGDYYFSFGGCHRYEAHKRLGLPSIRSKLVKSTVNDIRTYLGSSMPDLK